MIKAIKKFSLLFFLPIVLSCDNSNLLGEFGDTETDEALFFAAKQDINNGDYTAAITKFTSMSAEFVADRDVAIIYASAHAGRCGLDFLSFINAIKNIGTTKVLRLFMIQMSSATQSQITDCITADTLMQGISTDATQRTTDENLFMSMVNFSKVGIILNYYADVDNDGNVDGSFDSCTDDTDFDQDGFFPEIHVRQLGTGLSQALLSLQQVGNDVDTIGIDLTTLTTACSEIVTNLGASFDFCAVTDPADLTADMLRAIRSIVQEETILGIGSCPAGTKDLANCGCP